VIRVIVTFCESIQGSLETRILKKPTQVDLEKQLKVNVERLASHACFIGLYALSLEKLSSCFVRFIHKQR